MRNFNTPTFCIHATLGIFFLNPAMSRRPSQKKVQVLSADVPSNTFKSLGTSDNLHPNVISMRR